MPLFLKPVIKAFLPLYLLLSLMSSLFAADYYIIDPEHLITPEQKSVLEKNQEDIIAEYDALVSFAFYNMHITKLGARTVWEKNIETDPTAENVKDKFHLLICVGITSSRNMIDVYYKNPPMLQDVDDLENCISSLKLNLGSEINLDNLIENSAEPIMDQLSYLSARPKLEEDRSQEAQDDRSEKFMTYIFSIVKIALCIIIPIIAILILWYMLSSINNRRTHHFPVPPTQSLKKRLNAPYAATSISQPNL